jgi:hypothetical protein
MYQKTEFFVIAPSKVVNPTPTPSNPEESMFFRQYSLLADRSLKHSGTCSQPLHDLAYVCMFPRDHGVNLHFIRLGKNIWHILLFLLLCLCQ